MKQTLTNFPSFLSPLEGDILKMLWPDKKLKVRQLYEKLKLKRKVALSSIAVLLDRLHEKNIVGRTIENGRGGVCYVYFPKKDKNGFEKNLVENTVNKLIEKFGSNAVAYFQERFSRK